MSGGFLLFFLIPQQRYHDETRRRNDDTLMVRMKEWLMSYNDEDDGGYRGIKHGDEPGVSPIDGPEARGCCVIPNLKCSLYFVQIAVVPTLAAWASRRSRNQH